MAVLFGLAVRPSTSSPDELCATIKRRYHPLHVPGTSVSLYDPGPIPHPSLSDEKSGDPVISVLPKGTSFALPADAGFHLDLSEHERDEILLQLYELIRGLPGYEMALAGWDTDWNLWDLAVGDYDLITDCQARGLVITHELKAKLPIQCGFETFDEQHVWIPYQRNG